MINKSMKALEFDIILNMLCDYAVSENAKQKLLNLEPILSEREVIARINDTTEARTILDCVGTPPLSTMKDVEMLLQLSQKGAMLIPEQLTNILIFVTACNRMKSFLKRCESLNIGVAGYSGSINEMTDLYSEIEKSIRSNKVDDNASKELKNIRRKIDNITSEMKSKLDSLLRSKKEWFTDGYIASRNGHFVLPVKKEFKNQISGSVMDISSTGSTYFIVPNSVLKLEEERSLLVIAESNEERRILYMLTAMVGENAFTIRLNMEAMEALDFIFAKAKLSLDMKAVPAKINTNRYIQVVNGRHPLIKLDECVPLNFTIGDKVTGIVITGPNTGGKTVTLKTIGLIQLMSQCGLHVPCVSAEVCLNNAVLCDIGDGQSITENLSTFSSHISNIINIINHTDRDSLVLLDELGSGTDPAEGMGIAISILEELQKLECLFVATTHYPEIKEYASKTEGLVNARMAFDRESLKPLYRLEIGEAGESCALYIAKRLGFPEHMLERAYYEAYGHSVSTSHKLPDTDLLDNLNGTHAESTMLSESAFHVENNLHTDTKHHISLNKIIKEEPKKQVSQRSKRFQIGDSVMVYPQKKIGIIYHSANEKGEIGVQIKKTKELINHKRLQLIAPASELYPEDYDFSIIFDSVTNRKARHKMEKGYQPDLAIVYEKERFN